MQKNKTSQFKTIFFGYGFLLLISGLILILPSMANAGGCWLDVSRGQIRYPADSWAFYTNLNGTGLDANGHTGAYCNPSTGTCTAPSGSWLSRWTCDGCWTNCQSLSTEEWGTTSFKVDNPYRGKTKTVQIDVWPLKCRVGDGWSDSPQCVTPLDYMVWYSDDYAGPTPTPAPTVDIKANGSNGPITITYNTAATLSWTSTNATSCSASNGWSGTKGTSGSESTGNLTSSKTYTIICTGAGGSANDSVTVNVSAPTTPPTVDIKANGSDGPITIDYNTAATLSWTSTNATSCSASNGWSGGKATSGSESTGNLTSSKTYTIICTGAGGSANDSVTVNVRSAPVTCDAINAYVDPNPVATNNSITFTFTSNRGYTGVGFNPGGGASNCNLTSAVCGGNPKDGYSCWWRWVCTSTNAGNYTGTFTNNENCPKQISYTVSAPVTCDAINGYVDPNPVLGNSSVTFTFTSNRGYTEVNLNPGGGASSCSRTNAQCGGNPKDGYSCWWRWVCTSTNAGNYTGTFTNNENCPKQVSYTVSAPPSCDAINAYVDPNPVSANSSVVFTFTSNKGYTGVNLNPGGGASNCGSPTNAQCYGNPKDGYTCWWRWMCISTNTGNYTATFTNNENCPKQVSYTVSAPTCPYSSIQTKVRKTSWESWSSTLTLYPDEQFMAAIFKNGTDLLTIDGRLRIWGPSYSNSFDNGSNDDVFYALSLHNIGNYTVRGEIKGDENLSGCWNEISVRVISVPQLPTVDIKANGSDGPITIHYNTAATLTWTSTNATSCTASNGWTGAKALNNTSPGESTGNLTTSKIYTLTCTGTGRTAVDSVTVNVESRPPLPTVDIKANGSDGPISIYYNTAATLTWTSTNATSCVASNGWTGAKALNNTSPGESTGNLTSLKTYTLICTNSEGLASDSVTVNIVIPDLSVTLEAIPNDGDAPLYDVDLKATVYGTASGLITYRFDCTNNGDYEATFTNITNNPKTAVDLCDYVLEGTYVARVYIERGQPPLVQTAQALATIRAKRARVNNCPDAKIACDPANCTAYAGEILNLLNKSTDADGQSDIVKSEWDILGWGATPDFRYTYDPITKVNNSLNPITVPTMTLSRGTHRVQLYVEDATGCSDTDTIDFTIRDEIFAGFMCSINNRDWQVCETLKPLVGDTVYFKDDPVLPEHSVPSEGAVISGRTWRLNGTVFSTGNQSNTSAVMKIHTNRIRLDVTDTNTRSASVTHTIYANLPPPEWIEIHPEKPNL